MIKLPPFHGMTPGLGLQSNIACSRVGFGVYGERGAEANAACVSHNQWQAAYELSTRASQYSEALQGDGPDDEDPDQEASFAIETTEHDKVFVLMDCDSQAILPPAWQEEAFRKSMAFRDYAFDHIRRYEDWFRPTFNDSDIARNYKDEQ